MIFKVLPYTSLEVREQYIDTIFSDDEVVKSFSGTWLNDNIDASNAPLVSAKNNKGLTLKGNGGDDIITGSAGNDTITGGVGENTINYTFNANNGNDVINLTKGENLTIKIDSLTNIKYEYSSNKKDLIIYKEKVDGEFVESITLKNFASKDVANNSTKNTENTSSVILTDGETKVDLRNDRYFIGDSKILPEKSFTGTWLSEEINARNLEKFDKNGDELPYSSKGLTLDGKGGNDKIYGSYYSDTIKGGDGNDEIYGDFGNDVITGGAGINYIGHYFNQGNDIINLTKGENLTIEISQYYGETPLTISDLGFEFVNKNKDLKIYNLSNENQYFIIKNFVAKDVTNNSNAKKGVEDTSSVELVLKGESQPIDLREHFYRVDVEKNYTGSWLNEQIDASEYEPAKGSNGLTLNGKDGDDIIAGTKYSDTIKGGNGDDFIIGGTGNDKLYGEAGKNTFVFNVGDGADTIYSGKGEDTIKFGSTVDVNNIQITKSGNYDLLINYGFNDDGTVKDSVTINGYYNKKGEIVSSVKTVDFNGYAFELEEFRTITENYDKIILSSELMISGGSNNEYIFAKTTSDFQSVVASGGNDEIHTAARNVYLNSGNNKLYLSDAPDSSFTTVHLGSGNDTIYGAENKTVSISLHGGGSSPFAEQGQNTFYYRGGGLNLTCYKAGMYENSFFSKNGNDLTFSYQNTSLTIKDYYLYNSEFSEKFNITIYDINGDTIGRSLDELIAMKGGVKELLTGIEGGRGNDYIIGSDSAETINAGAGHDVINPSNGDDTINLGTGNDMVLAGNGNKTIEAVSGNNNIYLGSGNNTVKSGTGADTINSGSGTNTIEFASNDYTADTYFYGNGKDTLTFKGYELSDLLVEKLDENIVIKNNENNVITINGYVNPINQLTIKDKNNNSKTIENLDTKVGLSDAITSQTITTFDGNDIINTGLGDDVLNSGKGENTINLVIADAGNNDVYSYTQGASDTFVLPEEITDLTTMNFVKDGNNLIVSYGGSSANNTITISGYFALTESTINFKAGNTTESLKNLLDTYGYDETVYGTENADNIDRSSALKGVRIYGEGGNDTIMGSAKDDYIDGGAGADNIAGGAGNDTYIINSANWGDDQDTITDASGTNDTLKLNLTSTQKPFIYFEVTQNGTETNGNANYTTGNDLYINSTGFTAQTNPTSLNGVKIENYFTTGEIENIQTPDGENWITPDLLNKETINKVAQSIANFLKLKGLSSTQEIINGTDTALKNELSGLYQPLILNSYFVQSTNTNSSDILIATGGMEMRSGAGNDFLYGHSYIEKYLLGNGNKYVYIADPTNKTQAQIELVGTGNYKLFGGEGKPVNIMLSGGGLSASQVQNYGNIEFYSGGSYVKLQGYCNGMYENTFCIKENNDLTLKYYNTAVTIKDYYLMDETLQGKHYQYFYTEDGKLTNSGTIKSFVENKGGAKTLVNDGLGTSANEYIQGSANNDTLTSGGGDDVLRGEAGNDEYSAFVGTDIYIYDTAGNDKLTLSNTTTEGDLFDAESNKQVHVLFNVNSTFDGSTTFTNDVLLVDNTNLDLWKTSEAYKGILIKENAIETIKSNDNYTLTSEDINTLAANVAAWLVSDGREYGSVNDVLSGGNETDINALIAQFDTANWQSV